MKLPRWHWHCFISRTWSFSNIINTVLYEQKYSYNFSKVPNLSSLVQTYYNILNYQSSILEVAQLLKQNHPKNKK